jgi:hypothetical protein
MTEPIKAYIHENNTRLVKLRECKRVTNWAAIQKRLFPDMVGIEEGYVCLGRNYKFSTCGGAEIEPGDANVVPLFLIYTITIEMDAEILVDSSLLYISPAWRPWSYELPRWVKAAKP